MENHGDQRLFSSRIEKLCSIVKDFSNRVKNTNSKELVVSGCPLVIHRFRTLKLKVRSQEFSSLNRLIRRAFILVCLLFVSR